MMKNILFTILSLFPFILFGQVTFICEIQGSGNASALDGSTVTTEGVVTAVFMDAGEIGAFFMQEPNCDNDPLTSDGIYVYYPGGTVFNPGDRVSVSGTVDEYFGLTEITSVTAASLISSGNSFDTTDIIFPITSLDALEAVEGMYIRFPQKLVATDNFNWARYGEITFSFDYRLQTPTNILDPNDDPPSGTSDSGSSNVQAILDLQDLNNRNSILVDDAKSGQFPNPPPNMDANGTFRTGSEIIGLEGGLSYGFGYYRLQPANMSDIQHAARPSLPDLGNPDLKVASFNVLNFWTTLGGWGAQTANELDRQRTKLVEAILAMDADVIGLMELENNGAGAISDLLNALNEGEGVAIYEGLDAAEPGVYPTKSAIFYKPGKVMPVGPLRSLNDPVFERPSLSQIFEDPLSGEQFNFVLNHFRFKGCDGAVGPDLDQGDGQSCFNETRRLQAFSLLNFIDSIRTSTGVDKILIAGDFNAYSQEDPMDIIEGGGYERLLPLDEYSFVFFAQFGALDHAFASSEIMPFLTGASVWHINSDEPRALDWMDSNSAFYQPNEYRSSDHDPLIIGLDFNSTAVVEPYSEIGLTISPNPFSERVIFSFHLPSRSLIKLTIFDIDGKKIDTLIDGEFMIGYQSVEWLPKSKLNGVLTYKLESILENGKRSISAGKLFQMD